MRGVVPWLAAALGALSAACGYRVAGAANDPLGPFVVVSAPGAAPRAALVAAAEAGLRAELARAGELGAGAPAGTPGCSAVVVDVVRVEETSAAVAAGPAGAPPLAGAVRVEVTGRASVRRGEAEARATGDVTVAEVSARAAGSVAGGVASSMAAERAARRLGERLGRRVLGLPEPTDE